MADWWSTFFDSSINGQTQNIWFPSSNSFLTKFITSLILFFVFLYDVGISLYVIGFVVFTLIISDLLGRKQYKSYAKYLISQKIILIILSVSLYHIIGLTGVILGIAISFLPYSFVIYKEFKNSKIDF